MMLATLLLALGCSGADPERLPRTPTPSEAPADTAGAAGAVEAVGLVVAEVDEEVTALASGVLAEYHVGLGDRVEVGQPLARLDDPGLAHRVSRARARAASAASAERGAAIRAEDAARESASLDDLEGAVAKRDQDQALAVARESDQQALALRAGAVEARAELALLEQQSSALVLTSRGAGQVAALYKRLGEQVDEGDAVLRLVSSTRIVRFAADAEVPMRVDQPVEIVTPAGDRLQARIARVAPTVDGAGMVLAETTVLEVPVRSGEVCTVRLRSDASP